MGPVIVQVLPYSIASMLMPTWILFVLLLLRNENGPRNAIAFVAGVTTVRLLQGILFDLIVAGYESSHIGRVSQNVVGALFTAAGVLFWVVALLQLRGGDDLGDRFQWRKLLRAVTPVKAFGLGSLLVVTSLRGWLFTFAALGVIAQASLSTEQSILAYLLYVLGAQLLLVAPIIAAARSSAWLDAEIPWIERHARPIGAVVSFAVGAFLLWNGVSTLLG